VSSRKTLHNNDDALLSLFFVKKRCYILETKQFSSLT